ncbi:MAG: SDR family oxidoreductase [Acidobacteria bacterium]|nr:SDR family oxidoreductase [Acidobacteriota bacterium]
MGRLAQIREVAGALVYLASEAGSMVNRTVITVDGGWAAR